MNGNKYHVFMSFRGTDTRFGFSRSLHRALRGKGIKSFMDDEDLEKGSDINSALEEAIQNSRIAIVILSKNYATSTFCLEELSKIMVCSTEKGMLVLPVFYGVEPSDVRQLKGTYADALREHEAVRNIEKERLEKWRLALQNVANRYGWHFNHHRYRYEYELIESIVQDIFKKVHSLPDRDKNKIVCNLKDRYNAEHYKVIKDKAETNRGSGPFIYAGLFSPIREEPLPYSSPVRKRYRSYDEQVSSGNPQFGTALYDFPIALDDKTFVRWDPVHKDAVKKLFHSRASARLSDIFNDASKKKKKKRPSVITEELWPQLWQTSLTKFNHPDHLEKQEKSKQNRASSKGGSVHTGGSVNHAQYAQDMSLKIGRLVDVAQLFRQTHTRKDTGEFVDDRSRRTFEDYTARLERALSQVDSSTFTSDRKALDALKAQCWLEASGGKNKGRVYGTGVTAPNILRGENPLSQSSAPVPSQ